MSVPTLPPLYAEWLGQLLGGPLPSEPRSTCGRCAMVARGPEEQEPGPHFRADIKCCMFTPVLPNFLVGRLLRDPDPALAPGKETVRQRIAESEGVSANGLGLTREYADRYEQAKREGRFGLERELRCPHYLEQEGGLCGIWNHRESVCTTWFCRHERGAVSRHFWHSLQQLLSVVESALAKACATAIAGGAGFGSWRGQEEEFYEACARYVDELEWRDVARIGGFEVRFRARMVKEAWRALSERVVPPVLVPGKIRAVHLADGRRRVWGYSAYDPLDLPAEVVELLSRFNGRPVAEVLEEDGLGDGTALPPGLVFDRAMLERLFDLRILDMPPEA